jgi:hypothetical protein
MRRSCSILVLCVLLGFGVPLAAPAEDVPETPYDESEALPYDITRLFSIVPPQASGWKAKAELSCGSPLRSTSVTKECQLRRDNNARLRCFPDSLPILNHSLRC